jgi:hypothetical protein
MWVENKEKTYKRAHGSFGCEYAALEDACHKTKYNSLLRALNMLKYCPLGNQRGWLKISLYMST